MIPLAFLASPLVRKIGLYAAAGLAIFLLVRWYGNRQFYQGKEEGRQAATVEIERAKRAEWESRENAIAQEAASVAQAKFGIDEERAALGRMRRTLDASLKQSLDSIQAHSQVDNAKVLAVPDADLVRAVRALSAELARTGSTVAK